MNAVRRRSVRASRITVVIVVTVLLGSGVSACTTATDPTEPQPFEVHGDSIRGTNGKDGAPVLQVGRYTDTAPGPNATKHYIVRRELEQSTVFVGLSARPRSPAPDDLIALELWTVSGTKCGRSTSRDFDERQHNSIVTVAVDSTGLSASEQRACRNATELHLVVQPMYGASSLAGVDDELVVLEEPPTSAEPDMPAPVRASANWGPPIPMDQRTQVTPGTSFAEAPRLDPGNYRSSIQPGEAQIYRVGVRWGQRLRTQTQLPEPSPALLRQLDLDQQVDVRLVSPTRAEVGVDYTELPRSSAARIERTSPTVLTQMTYDVRYRNRDSRTKPYVAGAALSGDYYIVVTLSSDLQDEVYSVPYTLDVAVDDTSDGTGPKYPAGAHIAGPIAESPATTTEATLDLRMTAVTTLLALGLVLLAFGGSALLVVRRSSVSG